MTKVSSCGICSVLLWLAFSTLNARAAVIYSNLGPGDTFDLADFQGYRVIKLIGAPGIADAVASSFSTGPSDWNFTSAELALGIDSNPADSFTVSVMTDVNGLPGDVLQSIPLSGVSTSPALITVTPIEPLTLNSNTTYWIAINAIDDARCSWQTDNTGTDGGAEFGSNGVGVAWQTASSFAPALRVNGIIIPEPTSLPVISLLAASFFLSPRRAGKSR